MIGSDLGETVQTGKPELEKENSLYLALFIVQYSMIVPLSLVLNPALLVAIFSTCICLLVMYRNRSVRIERGTLLIILIVTIAILLKNLFDGSSLNTLLTFAYTAIPCAIVTSCDTRSEYVLTDLYHLSLICIPLVVWYPFVTGYNYMRFGYAIVPIIISISVFKPHDSTRLYVNDVMRKAICVALSLELLVCGARGSMLTLALFVAIYFCLLNRSLTTSRAMIISACGIVYFNLLPILTSIKAFFSSHGRKTYALTKLIMMLEKGFDVASSGRDSLYGAAWETISQNPLLGTSIHLFDDDEGGGYVHNLFIEVLLEFGILGLIPLVALLLFDMVFVADQKNDTSDRIMVSLLFSLAIGRLMFSSTLWRRPDFWLLVFMSVKYCHNDLNKE